ncbi:SAM-dependent methyltransferase [Nocardia sp. CA-290969]|uniref:SAM-dependent methyltransferase n=1 Tax=Nocardia sp. CA-290969 TaxID=3239986 RepID=UPI003D8AC50B
MSEAVRTPATRRPAVAVDVTRPSIPRVYNYSLRGKDNYSVDILAWRAITDIAPNFGYVHLRNQAWLARATRFLAQNAEIHQFIHLGAGLPAFRNTHQYAQEWDRTDVHVLYIDSDPVCVAHGQVLLAAENVRYLPGDLTNPEEILKSSCRGYFDLDRPIALLLTGILPHIGDDQQPAEIMTRYANLLPAGSYIAITHYLDPGPADPERHSLARELEKAFLGGLGSGWFRTREQILDLFAGLKLVHPGLVELDDWWPEGPSGHERTAPETLMVGGIAYKRRGGTALRSVG